MNYHHLLYNALITSVFFIFWNTDSGVYDAVKLFIAYAIVDGVIVFTNPRLYGGYFKIAFGICRSELKTKFVLFTLFMAIDAGLVILITLVHYILTICTISELTSWCSAILLLGWISQHYSPKTEYIKQS